MTLVEFNTELYSIVMKNLLKLKLKRTPLNVYFTAFKSIFLSLYAPITSDEYHA